MTEKSTSVDGAGQRSSWLPMATVAAAAAAVTQGTIQRREMN